MIAISIGAPVSLVGSGTGGFPVFVAETALVREPGQHYRGIPPRSTPMPTPLQLLLDPTSLTVFAIFGPLLLLEALLPAPILPRVRSWRLAGLTAFGLFFFLSSYLPLLWSQWLVRFQLFDLTALPLWAGVLAALLGSEEGPYAWHRSVPRSPVLLRGVPQLLHSAQRLDPAGAFGL